ncbi:MAG: hypothetical protein HY906_09090 [Deltaproteobacteria bacterium]|nr:hypothetical protein [Deltaproteobacteria bacterium]
MTAAPPPDVVNASAGMYQPYLDCFTGVSPHIKVFAHCLHNGEWSSGGAWGAERQVGQPLAEAHKPRAINDWIAAHPWPREVLRPAQKGESREGRSRCGSRE